ncbi:hypothetical protein [Desulfobacter sp.]|uniref:hypothetical protein n=1 Tax=Desulfobacter sp. TaxID=2294 RepID=UPI003D0CD61F
MKDDTMAAIRNFRNLSAQMETELKKIDPGLRDGIRKEREAQVREKYQGHLDANLDKIRSGRAHFEAARAREADPMKALIKKAWATNDTRPGMGAVCAALETMGPEAQLELARELNHPIIALRAVSNIQKMDIPPLDRINLGPAISSLIAGHVDIAKIRDYAMEELTCLETEFEAMRSEGAESHKILSMGHRISVMKKIIATGQLPKSERVDSLTHGDPQERLNAARTTVGD